MSIIKNNGYKYYDSSDTIIIEDERIEEYVEYINKNGITSIALN